MEGHRSGANKHGNTPYGDDTICDATQGTHHLKEEVGEPIKTVTGIEIKSSEIKIALLTIAPERTQSEVTRFSNNPQRASVQNGMS